MPSRLAPKLEQLGSTVSKPVDEDMVEVINDALDDRHKSSDTFKEDLLDAFHQMPQASCRHAAVRMHVPSANEFLRSWQDSITRAAALCRDLGNEAMKRERWDEAVE